MTKISLWVVSVLFLVMAVLTVVTSVLASLAFLLVGVYLSPFVRARYLQGFKANILLGARGGAVITLILTVFGVMQISGAQDEDRSKRQVRRYQENQAEFTKEVRAHLEANEFFKALYDLDPLLAKLPEDDQLKSLRHEVVIKELKHNAAKGELYRFDVNTNDFERHKKIVGSGSRASELEEIYEGLAVANTKKSLGKEDVAQAKIQINRLLAILPNSSKADGLKNQLAIVEKKVHDREEAKRLAEQRQREKEEASRAASQNSNYSAGGGSTGGMSRVVSKVGSLIYLANGQTFAIERPTMLHIDGQIYPKGSGSPDYIQVGYRCRFTGEQFNVSEVFCER